MRSTSAVTLFLCQAKPHPSTQEGGRFFDVEAQIRCPYLDDLPAGAQSRQRQRRVLPAGDHQMQRRWQVFEQEDDRGVHGGVLDGV